MKSFMLLPLIAVMMISCKNEEKNAVAQKDAATLQIESLKEQLELQKIENARQTAIDSMQLINELQQPMAIAAAPAPEPVKTKVVYVREPRRKVTTPAVAQTPAPVQAENPVPAPTPTIAESQGQTETASVPAVIPAKEKKGWSNTAKGAVIGLGAGAIGGAIINKKKPLKGAVIGGVIGAAAGAGTGILLDKRKKRLEEFQ